MDRRFIWALVLMMVIIIAPTFWLKPPARRPGGPTPRPSADSLREPAPPLQAGPDSVEAPGPRAAGPSGVAAPAETLVVASPLYEYAIASRGGGIVEATMLKYQALDSAHRGQRASLLHGMPPLHVLALEAGGDTVSLAGWDFEVQGGAAAPRRLGPNDEETVTLRGSRGGVLVELAYTFSGDDYQIGVGGTVRGLGPVGGHLIVGMGNGFRQTEADSAANLYEFGVVTKTDESKLLKYSALDPGERRTLDGPFEWAAVKSKYFVAALLAVDTTRPQVSGVRLVASPLPKADRAEAAFTVPVPASGSFGYRLYVGPMEYPRLRAIGHDFYDINPYGWPGFRTMIRPIATGARWLLVWMHENLNLAYGMVLVLFGVMIRILLWPLNQKGMRASIRMQGLQPEMQRIQERHKDDPQQLQREVMALYKREGVNPFSGCWPMLLPWPILLALFFVFANTIELRGQPFLWLPDLSLKDPLYIIPVLMGASMFALNKVGMAGMPPTPQTKMMLYFLPLMMTVLFVNFASGLNLYYFVQNVVSLPQQWYLARERQRAAASMAAAAPAPVVGTRKKKGT